METIYPRLKQIKGHYQQLEPSKRRLVVQFLERLDDLTENLLLEQEYEGKADFIREYRKAFSLKEIKKSGRKNRLVLIDSRQDGKIREVNSKSEENSRRGKIKFLDNLKRDIVRDKTRGDF
ncbi:hypothetical protein PXY30_004449 [Salmonella enterica]|nr:hypothetical protein [Salmonella enterica]